MDMPEFGWKANLQHQYEAFRQGCRGLFEADPLEPTIILTLIMFLLYPGDVWYLRIPVKILVMAALIHRPLARSPVFWFMLCLVHAIIQNLMHWYISDNHKYLYSYWCLALGCGLSHRTSLDIIANNARALIGLTFLFAFCRKLLEPVYLSGATFHYLLFTDSRFSEVARTFGNMTLVPMESPERYMATLQPIIAVPSSPQLMAVAQALTWWTLIIEGAIAYFFLRSRAPRGDVLATATLILFILSVYSIAPVLGFASVLIILGYAQCTPEMKRTRICYLILFLFMQLFSTNHVKSAIFALLDRWMGLQAPP